MKLRNDVNGTSEGENNFNNLDNTTTISTISVYTEKY